MFFKQNIKPKPFVYPVRIVNSVEIQIVNLILFQSVSILVSLYDEENNIIENKYLTIDGDDYQNWSNNDQFLIDLVLTKMDLEELV